jgi:hypothetical protein
LFFFFFRKTIAFENYDEGLNAVAKEQQLSMTFSDVILVLASRLPCCHFFFLFFLFVFLALTILFFCFVFGYFFLQTSSIT